MVLESQLDKVSFEPYLENGQKSAGHTFNQIPVPLVSVND